MKKLIILLIVFMMTMNVGFAYRECPCADGNDLSTSVQEGTDASKDYAGADSKFWGLALLALSGGTGHLCLHGNRFFLENGQASLRILPNSTVYLYDCRGYGEMVSDTAAWSWALLDVFENGRVIIDGGFYTAQGQQGTEASVAINNKGTVIVHDAVITGNPVLKGNDIIVGENSVLIEKTDTRIIVAKHPVITFPEAKKIVEEMEGNTVTFKVEANDWRPLTYRWFCNGTAISGADKAEYSVPAELSDDGNTYYCIVTNDVSLSATSSVYELKVNPDPNRVPPAEPQLPATGDGAFLTLWMGMLMLAGAAFIGLRKKAVR